MMIGPLVIKILLVFNVLGEDNILVHILISTHLFGSVLGSDELPYPMLALDPLFVMSQQLVVEISLVFIVLEEDNALVRILITTHLFN